MQPESYFCEEHGRKHKKGSAIYDECLPDDLKALEEEEEEESEVEEPEEGDQEESEETEEEEEPEPEPVAKKVVAESVKVGPNEVMFNLKKESPGTVTVRTGSFGKTFSRTMEPFVADAVVFEKVLEPTGFFERG